MESVFLKFSLPRRSYVIREMQIKTSKVSPYPLERPKSETLTIPNPGEDVEQEELSFIAGGNATWYSYFGRQFSSFSRNWAYAHLQSSSHALWYLPEGAENLCPHKNLHMDVYISFIHNFQNLEATKTFFF